MATFMLALFRFLSHWPLWLLHTIGAFLGWLIYGLSPTYRRHLKENLFLALGEAKGREVLPSAVAAAGRGVLELPKVWVPSQKDAVRLATQLSGWEVVQEAQARGEGIIFLTPHLGCFEITAHCFAANGGPITVLYRPPKKRWIQPLIEAGRGGGKLKLAPADVSGVRNLLKALKKREAVGLLPDQVPGAGEGIRADFFGKPALTMTLAARLTQVADTCVILAYAERLPQGQGFRMVFTPPQQPITGTLAERVQAINHEMEALIRLCPEQYLWGYNRYKNVPPADDNAPTV